MYSSFVADLSSPHVIEDFSNKKTQEFDLVICDVPCSGSGTWGRTPEQLYYFHEEKIEYYNELQKSIVQNVLPMLKKGGYLLYITCSIFKKENEDVVNFLIDEFGLSLQKKQLLIGYEERADTLFGTLLKKIS